MTAKPGLRKWCKAALLGVLAAATSIVAQSPAIAQPLDAPFLPGSDSCQYTGPLALGKSGRYLTVNSRPMFLTFASYFDVMDTPISVLKNDMMYLRRKGITGIRVFPNWWKQTWTDANRTTSTLQYAGNALMDTSGNLRTTELGHLKQVLAEAQKCGMVVDVSFSAETIGPANQYAVGDPVIRACAPPISRANYHAALNAVTTELVSNRNALFDIQNEADQVGVFRSNCSNGWQGTVDTSKIAPVVASIHAIDPSRLLVTATDGQISQTISHTNATGLDVITYHERTRPTNWWATSTSSEVSGLVSATTLPVYLQEPSYHNPHKSGHSAFGGPEFKSAVMRAHKEGAAAWTFHNESCFQLDGASLESKLWPEEKEFLQYMRQNNAQGLGSSALGDFNGDTLDDIADFTLNSGAPGFFYIRKNLGSGTFTNSPFNDGHGKATEHNNLYFKTLVGDFTGDGKSDFADFRTDNGEFWIHASQGGTPVTFAYSTHGILTAGATGAEWEHLVGDVNGDLKDDIIAHNLRTGAIRTHINPGTDSTWPAYQASPGIGAAINSPCPASGNVCAGGPGGTNTEWRFLVADFTGDGKADYADFQLTGWYSGYMWVHVNDGMTGGTYNFTGGVWAQAFPSLNADGVSYAPPYIAIPAQVDGVGGVDMIYLDRVAGSFMNFLNMGGWFSTSPWGPGNSFTVGDSWRPLGQMIRMLQ